MVRQSSSADADAAVLVGVNHFSERTITMSDGGSTADGGSTTDGGSTADGSNTADSGGTADGGSTTDGNGDGGPTSVGTPGFGVAVAVVVLLGAALIARRRP